MRAAIFEGPEAVEVGERPDPVIQEPTDAVVRVVLSCVCGSDLWYYRGESAHAAGSIGHEFIGIVEQAGAGVRNVRPGDLVVAPFIYSDMSCPHCLNGSTISCVAGGNFGDGQVDGGQGRRSAYPLAGSTLVPVPGSGHPEAVLRSLLALSDVMSTTALSRESPAAFLHGLVLDGFRLAGSGRGGGRPVRWGVIRRPSDVC